VTPFHHQPEAQHPKSSAINKPSADYPISPQSKFLLAAGTAPLCRRPILDQVNMSH
jgi:hypothetical protein